MIPKRDRQAFTRSVTRWARKGLRDFVWRQGSLSPFGILTAEMLLTRTRADTVARVLPKVLKRYPDPQRMARGHQATLERIISPLGLQAKRAGHLKATARELLTSHEAEVPHSEEHLLALPGVGQYAADATLSVAFQIKRPIVDANVARLLQRCFDLPPPGQRLSKDANYRTLATSLLPEKGFLEYNWALLDIGAAFCKPGTPACHICPLTGTCVTGAALAH